MSKSNSDAVAERRLRPIYDWLDAGNNKKAVQEAEKVLKKQPDLLCAKVLKGLALLRLGKSKDCEVILENVKQEAPADDYTLQAMTICYREIHKLDNICDVYEKAVLKDPQNEELNTHLFMSYVRISDFKKQQQVALNLYKLKPKNPYYFWGVMSILMQAQNGDDNIAQKIQLPLAERMVKKFISEGKIEAEQEVQLYIMILEMQKKYEETLNVIDSELGHKLLSNFSQLRKRIILLEMLQKWQILNIYCKKLLLEEPDAYGYYVKYIDSVFNLMDQETNLTNEKTLNGSSSDNIIKTIENQIITPDSSIESCISFIERNQQQTKVPHKLRGPHLAMILLCKRLIEKGYNPSKYLGNTIDLFKNYFELFADKPCCFKDLHQFLPLVQAEYVPFLSATWNLAKTTNEEVKNKNHLFVYLTHFQLSRYFGIQKMFSVNDKLTQISRLLDFYHDGHRFNINLTSTDLGCSDSFLILVVHLLHDLYLDTNDLKFLKDAVCLLEYGYSFSPSNHHFKLLLLKFYNMLGATKVGYKYFHLLEIKHMQYDSLGYLVCWSLLYSGQYSFAVYLLDNTLKFFNINYKEAADQLTHAYKYGSFEKVIEFLNFRERLKNSFHYSLVTIEHLINDLIHLPSHETTMQSAQQLSINPEKPIADSNHLVDNRDLFLFLNFDSDSRRMNDEYAKLSFEHEVKLIRLRTMLLRCIGASINVCLYASPTKDSQNNSTNSHPQKNGIDDSYTKHLDIFMNVIVELRDMYTSFVENPPKEIPRDVFSGVERSRLFLYGKSSFFLPLFIDAMSFAHEFYMQCLNDNIFEEAIERMAEISAGAFAKLVADCGTKVTSLQSSFDEADHREIFEFFSLTVEMVCIMSIICGNMHAVLIISSKNAAAPARRKKKKGKESAAIVNKSKESEEGALKLYNHYLGIVQQNTKTLEVNFSHLESCWEVLESHKPGFKLRRWPSDESLELQNSPILGIPDQKWEEIQTEVNKNISDSYRSSIKQFRNVVKHKTDYLALLSL